MDNSIKEEHLLFSVMSEISKSVNRVLLIPPTLKLVLRPMSVKSKSFIKLRWQTNLLALRLHHLLVLISLLGVESWQYF